MRRFLAAFALLLLPLVLVSAAPSTASADVGAPTWWNGDCDASHWNAAAASMGWTGAGAHRLGASYLGVPVCGPRRSGDGAPDVQWLRSGWGHFEWECTELAFRFMAQVYGVSAYGANGNGIVRNYLPSYGGGLVRVNNGTPGVAPKPGDIISFDSAMSSAGHAGVVASTTVDPNGNGSILMMSQNDTADGWRTLSVANWTVQAFGTQVPYGWLHDPAGRGGPGVAGGVTGTPQGLGDGPGAASIGDGSIDVFVRGIDDGLWTRHLTATSWSGWMPLGGVIKSQPAAVSSQPGSLDVYAVGSDGAVWARHFDANGWSSWWTLGGLVTNAPTVVSSSVGSQDIFAVGSDAALWTRRLTNGSWSGWISMGGVVTSAPGATATGAGTIDVFDRGADGALWTRHGINGAWTSWTSLGGMLTSSPAATSSGAGVIDVFARGVDGAIWARHSIGGTWSNWMSAGGITTSPPASVSVTSGTIDLFVRGGDNALWVLHSTSGVLGTWTSLGGVLR